jgi:hypothetical protein
MEREAEMMTLLSIPIHPRATDEDIVEEIFRLLWFEFGAQLCNFEFYARHVTRLQATFGHDAVSAALQRHHRQMRRAVSDQIRLQRTYAARLKRGAEGL